MAAQFLDSMDLERERGITIKASPIQMFYDGADGETYELNLLDTPGHVEFSYEVSRSVAACEGALLVVDASQGIQAQTLANVYLAMEHDLYLIPVVNKIDLPGAEPERVAQELVDALGFARSDIFFISAKGRRRRRRAARRHHHPRAAALRRPRGPDARAHLRLQVRLL